LNNKIKKQILSIINYIYALSILSLCVSVVMILAYGFMNGFSNLEVSTNKIFIVIGIPIVILLFTKFLSKKIGNNSEEDPKSL